MELIFLGTSSGTPTKFRNVSGLALKCDNAKGWYLIDCGEGTQHRLLRTNLSLLTLETIFITHMHGDHCYGLPGLLGSASMSGREKVLTIVCPESVKEFVEKTLEITQVYLSYELRFMTIEEQKEVVTSQFDVTIQKLSHRVPSYAFTFTESGILPKLNTEKLLTDGIPAGPLWGEIQRGSNVTVDGTTINATDYLLPARRARRVIVAGDNDTPAMLQDVASKADILVHESTYTDEMAIKMGDAPQHCSAKRAAVFAEEQQVQNLILTHFSPRYRDFFDESPCIGDIRQEAESYYSGNLHLAKDLEKLALDRSGKLSVIED